MLVSPVQDDYYYSVNKEIPIILDDILIDDEGIYPFYKDFGIHGMGGGDGETLC